MQRHSFFLCLAVCLISPFVEASSHPKRLNINSQDGCNFLAASEEQPFIYEQRCAAALSQIKLAGLGDQCLLWNETGLKLDTLFDLLQTMRNRTRPAKFYAFKPAKFLLEVPCNEGAYNQSSVFFAYDESVEAPGLKQIQFSMANGKFASEIASRHVSVKAAQVFVYSKERGIGDSGYYARYALDRKTLSPTLLEVIEKKNQQDGKDPFHWTGRLKDKPKGEGWVQKPISNAHSEACELNGPPAQAPAAVKKLRLGISKFDLEAALGQADYSPIDGQYYFTTGGDCFVEGSDHRAPCGVVADFRKDEGSDFKVTQSMQSCWWGAIAE
jgi:hypothetical protein